MTRSKLNQEFSVLEQPQSCFAKALRDSQRAASDLLGVESHRYFVERLIKPGRSESGWVQQ